MDSKGFSEMHWLASKYEMRPDVVQGAGGNVSVKISDELMLIKASGRDFSELKNESGLVPVFYKNLQTYLLDPTSAKADERTHLATALLNTKRESEKDRPSMEVWFHTLLHKYVLHTHSVYVNILACSEEGSALFGQIMKRNNVTFQTFPYYNPGFELGHAMARQFQTTDVLPAVIFLENHGIIVHADALEECATLHEIVEEKIKEALDIESAVFDMSELQNEEIYDFEDLTIFPDQVIYPAHAAIRAAHRFILKHVRARGFHIRTIPGEHVHTVKNMESEEYRKGLKA
jgi:rhamnose utilization protein RhaD (predicted bifunctional aldolase and dehydrogenase)